MKRAVRISAGTIGLTMLASIIQARMASADLSTFNWASSGGTLSVGTNSNVVGFWQTVGYTQVVCPGGWYDGKFGSNTAAQTKRMQNELPSPGIAQTGVVNAATWNAIQNAVTGHGPLDFARLIPGAGVTYSQSGAYTYYGGSGAGEANLAWQGPGAKWKFEVWGTSSWFNATTSRTMGSTYAC